MMNTKHLVRRIWRNPFFRFFVVAGLYVVWVQWIGQQLLLLGVIVIADIFLTKFVNWRFWRKRKSGGEKHKVLTEIIDSLIIAVLLAIFIRIFFAEAYRIPTSSMEKTLSVGDYILVSKLRYGPRLPITPITMPFTHNTMPFTTNRNSFSTRIRFPYKRLKGFSQVKNFDVVVFNYPVGDTVIMDLVGKSYYYMVRQHDREYVHTHYTLQYRPVDKRDNYTKRAIGIPGDTVEIIHGRAYINNKAEPAIEGCQFNYSVKTQGSHADTLIMQKLAVSLYDVHYNVYNSIYNMPLTRHMYHTLIDSGYFKAIVRYESTDPSAVNRQIFPFSSEYNWTEDNYGPVWVPQRGASVNLSLKNLPLYRRIIAVYEKNKLDIINDSIYINDTLATSYTFRMNYYFMLGDNRHNSKDSRYWGFVPEDHIIGKAGMVWLSLDKSQGFMSRIRWKRMFRRIR